MYFPIPPYAANINDFPYLHNIRKNQSVLNWSNISACK